MFSTIPQRSVLLVYAYDSASFINIVNPVTSQKNIMGAYKVGANFPFQGTASKYCIREIPLPILHYPMVNFV